MDSFGDNQTINTFGTQNVGFNPQSAGFVHQTVGCGGHTLESQQTVQDQTIVGQTQPTQQVITQPQNNTQHVTLGSKLRGISASAKPRAELQSLSQILISKAEAGYIEVKFRDIREIIPTIAGMGIDTLKNWCESEELKLTGQVNQSTAAWEYTIGW